MLNIQNEYFHLSVDLARSHLTPREKDVVALLPTGCNVTAIARIIRRSAKTVSAQKHSAYKKLGVRSDVTQYPGLMKRWGMQVTCRPGESQAAINNINISTDQAS